MTLPLSFYQEQDVVKVGKALLGKQLFTEINGELTGGIIVETESYAGINDRASHSYNNRRTMRTEPMFQAGGITYVYLCYGIHNLLNIVTNKEGIPQAILIRAIEPTVGHEIMMQRRNQKTLESKLTAGPGALTQALGITREHNNKKLTSSPIWIIDAPQVLETQILASPRVGVSYAKEDALLPYRFRIKDHLWTSPA